MRILHVETGMHLYGGAQQVAYLLDGLVRRGIDNVLVCPPGAAIAARVLGTEVEIVEVHCGGDVDLGFVFRLRHVIARERPQHIAKLFAPHRIEPVRVAPRHGGHARDAQQIDRQLGHERVDVGRGGVDEDGLGRRAGPALGAVGAVT